MTGSVDAELNNETESRLGPITVVWPRISSDLLLVHSVTLVGCTFVGQGSADVWSLGQ